MEKGYDGQYYSEFQFHIGTVLLPSVLVDKYAKKSNKFQFLIGTVLRFIDETPDEILEELCFNSL